MQGAFIRSCRMGTRADKKRKNLGIWSLMVGFGAQHPRRVWLEAHRLGKQGCKLNFKEFLSLGGKARGGTPATTATGDELSPQP